MTVHNMINRTYVNGKRASTGQTYVSIGKETDSNIKKRLQNLENTITSQAEKLDQIAKLLNELSEKKSAS
jgi:predicted transcriptional regulator|tara:strand:+ start:64 stop:273 length:210 start_codon:yes stop_codon:yes gene_type:complete